jgi:VWFA-related protein
LSRHRGRRYLTALLLVGPVALFAQQTPQPMFRTAAHLVITPVTVKDKQGKPIEGLTPKDFVLTEDGVAQEIAFAEFQKLDAPPGSTSLNTGASPGAIDPAGAPVLSTATSPIRPPAASGVEPVVTESPAVPGDAKYHNRRLLVLYLDLYNMPFFDQLRMYSGAEKYIDKQMTADDLVAIMIFSNGAVRLKQNFTDDRNALRDVIQGLVQAADDTNNGNGITFETGGAFGEDDDTFNLFSTDRQLAALQTAVTDLGPLPEVKTLVYMGSGLRLNGADNLAQLRATVNAAVRASVTINPVDTRGLVAMPPLGDATRASPSGIGMFSGSLVQAATTRQQQAQDTYYALAKDTGGKPMFDNNDLSMGIVQAAQAVTGYYMIGYYTKNLATDGKFRRVKVSLAPGVNADADLSYRAGYYGAKDYSKFNAVDKERQLEDALKAEDPITDIPMAMEINYFQISSAEYFVPVSVRMPGSELLRPSPGLSARSESKAEIDMIGEIKDEYGVTIRNAKDYLQFKLDPAKAAEVARRPIQYETGFSLLPGNYVIKVLARDTTTGRIGTYQKSFVVPNLEREHTQLPISTVVLTSQRVTSGDALFTVTQKISADVANPLVFEGWKLIPSVSRTFSASRELYVFLQAYERDPPSPEASARQAPPSPGTTARQGSTTMRPLVAFVTFYRDGVNVFETEPLSVDTWDPKLKAVPIRLSIPPGTLQPGSYDCQVTVLDPTGGKAAFWRAAVVVVR